MPTSCKGRNTVIFSENLVPLFYRNKHKLNMGNSLKILWAVQVVKEYKWKSTYHISGENES